MICRHGDENRNEIGDEPPSSMLPAMEGRTASSPQRSVMAVGERKRR